MAPVPGSPWKCVSRMTSLPPSPHTHTHIVTRRNFMVCGLEAFGSLEHMSSAPLG